MSEAGSSCSLRSQEGHAIDQAAAALSIEEMHAAVAALSAADKVRLHTAATTLAGGALSNRDDLIQEAILRALDGTRHCPRGVKPVVFLIGVMRSIVSAERLAVSRAPALEILALGEDDKGVEVECPDQDQEEGMLQRERCEILFKEIDDLFVDDEEARMILMGQAEGLSPAEIQELVAINAVGYATALRRIRRRINTRFPKGCTHGRS